MVIFGKKKEEESYVEVDESKLANQKGINIKIEELNGFTDTDRIQNIVREGNVVFLRIKNLRQKDINELKRSVDKLKKTIIANEGDIVGVDEDFLILTPKFVKVFR